MWRHLSSTGNKDMSQLIFDPLPPFNSASLSHTHTHTSAVISLSPFLPLVSSHQQVNTVKLN